MENDGMLRKMGRFFKKNPFLLFLLIVFITGTGIYGTYLVRYNSQNTYEQEKYEELERQSFVLIEPRTAILPVEPTEHNGPYMSREDFLTLNEDMVYREMIEGKAPDFKVLREKNPDVVAYLLIPGTKISYPVMCSEDNGYYLGHNMDGSKGYPGCLFIENYNSEDFEDPLTVIYGHNMKNGSMFGSLNQFGDEDYRKEHPYIFLYLPDEVRAYELVAASEYSDEHILKDCFRDEEGAYVFEGFHGNEGMGFIEKILLYEDKDAYIDADSITEEEQVLVLSTCENGNTRYVIGAKRVL